MSDTHALRISALRKMMSSKGWDAIIIRGTDPHYSEYFSTRWHQVEWLSGYEGEGDLVITRNHAGIWTDSRYFIQFKTQLADTEFVLHPTRMTDSVSIETWLAREAFPETKENIAVAVDIASVDDMKYLSEAFIATGRYPANSEEAEDKTFTTVNAPDFIDALWEDRPPIPQNPIITLSNEITGESRTERIARLREHIAAAGCDAILISALDDIAYLLNVRGSDIEYNPLVISYLLVTQERTDWFVLKGARGAKDVETVESFRELEADGINIMQYDDVFMSIAGFCDGPSPSRIMVDSSCTSHLIVSQIEKSGIATYYATSPVALWKSVKNDVEIKGMREAHLIDGIALEKFFFWLEGMMNHGATITEYDAAMKLHEIRAENPSFMGESFETISAYGKSAALPHYVTPEEGSEPIVREGFYLCDSGGQYMFGTTDVTRTMPMGPCSRLEKEDYTLVLKGHIDLAMAVFPKGTAGCQIDALAREPLWAARRNFGHGTGHGVGFFLNVHEGPQDIRQNFNRQPLLPGMITSDEPAIYREGAFGIRHENLLLCREDGTSGFGSFLSFETLTLCHFDTSCIIADMLTKAEKEWLNEYNDLVYRTLSPHLPSRIANWLDEKTKAI